MGHFYGSMVGSRAEKTCTGHKTNGLRAHVRTYTCGVEVVATHYDTQPSKSDGFAIYATNGSDGVERFYLGEVVLDKKGNPTFKKAKSWQK
jgi:hypothetical protein